MPGRRACRIWSYGWRQYGRRANCGNQEKIGGWYQRHEKSTQGIVNVLLRSARILVHSKRRKKFLFYCLCHCHFFCHCNVIFTVNFDHVTHLVPSSCLDFHLVLCTYTFQYLKGFLKDFIENTAKLDPTYQKEEGASIGYLLQVWKFCMDKLSDYFETF